MACRKGDRGHPGAEWTWESSDHTGGTENAVGVMASAVDQRSGGGRSVMAAGHPVDPAAITDILSER